MDKEDLTTPDEERPPADADPSEEQIEGADPVDCITYSSNNSGGGWWLSDDNWFDLAAAGWKVAWKKDEDSKYVRPDKDGRWLGALATTATREGLSLADAIEEWERVTGKDSTVLGCSCCGPPHSFSRRGPNGEYEYYSPSYPEYGERYRP